MNPLYRQPRLIRPRSPLGFHVPWTETRVDGTQISRRHNGRLHRIDGPAVRLAKGARWELGVEQVYCLGPAQIHYLDDVIHRLDGPAVIIHDGGEMYRLFEQPGEGQIGTILLYYYDGSLHRMDGPAVVGPGPHREWWVHGTFYNDAREWADRVNQSST